MYGHEAAYDLNSHRVLLFGGSNNVSLNETRAYNGTVYAIVAAERADGPSPLTRLCQILGFNRVERPAENGITHAVVATGHLAEICGDLDVRHRSNAGNDQTRQQRRNFTNHQPSAIDVSNSVGHRRLRVSSIRRLRPHRRRLSAQRRQVEVVACNLQGNRVHASAKVGGRARVPLSNNCCSCRAVTTWTLAGSPCKNRSNC